MFVTKERKQTAFLNAQKMKNVQSVREGGHCGT